MSHNHYRRMMDDSVEELAELQKSMESATQGEDAPANADLPVPQAADQASDQVFLAIDADNAGRLVGRAVLADDAQGLSDVSGRIDHGQELILSWAQQVGGQRISSGGDETTVSIPSNALEQIEVLRKDYEHATGLTITVGVGQSLSQAGKALMAGKFRGKNQVCQYDESVESDLVAAGKNVEAGNGSEEEQKLNEQYLQKDDHSHENCEYCQEYDAKNGADSTCDCPYCAAYDAQQAGSTCDCPYCQQYDAENEHSHDNCPHCQEYDAKQAAQPAQPEEDKIIPGGDVGGVGEESSPQDVQDPSLAPQSDGMDENQSHPDDYSQNVPGDMGLSEDEVPQEGPDLGQVLQGGLDNHADQIQKEKVGDMVGQALEKLKSQKQILEKAKEQAPDLYLGVILMMKSMIEMAKMLGFGGEVQPDQEPAPSAPEQGEDPKPAAPQEGAAPAPKGISQ